MIVAVRSGVDWGGLKFNVQHEHVIPLCLSASLVIDRLCGCHTVQSVRVQECKVYLFHYDIKFRVYLNFIMIFCFIMI